MITVNARARITDDAAVIYVEEIAEQWMYRGIDRTSFHTERTDWQITPHVLHTLPGLCAAVADLVTDWLEFFYTGGYGDDELDAVEHARIGHLLALPEDELLDRWLDPRDGLLDRPEFTIERARHAELVDDAAGYDPDTDTWDHAAGDDPRPQDPFRVCVRRAFPGVLLAGHDTNGLLGEVTIPAAALETLPQAGQPVPDALRVALFRACPGWERLLRTIVGTHELSQLAVY